MATRAIWKAVLVLGDERVPVKLYSGVLDRKVRFHLLHEPDLARVEQRMVDPVSDRPVPYDEVRRGFEVEPGTFVLLDDDDLEAIEPEPSREIEISRFVPGEVIDHRWYDRPYWLGPDDAGEEPYAALVAALDGSGREGVARWTMRKKSYVGALGSADGRLTLITMRRAGEVVPVSALTAPSGREIDASERKMARQLLGALEGPFDADDWRDTHRGAVMELIEAKASGKVVRLSEPERKAAAGDLGDALKASLAAARKSA